MTAPRPLILDILAYLSKPEGYAAAEEILHIVSVFYPPAAGIEKIMEIAVPNVQHLAGHAEDALAEGLADGTFISLPDGGIISRQWAADKRHQLVPDGRGGWKFKY